MKIAFYTLGCKTNQFETQALERLFAAHGHEICAFSEICDVYVINTCTVTSLGDKKSRIAARKAKKLNPSSILAVCGCYSEVNPDEVRHLCGADIVIGSRDKGRLVELVESAFRGLPLPCLTPNSGFDLLPAGNLSGRTRALLKVQDGCQNYCTYCLIPFARGKCRSLPLDIAISETKRLASEGYSELVITGIEISSYGVDLSPPKSLLELISAICDAAPNVRIHLGSLEPRTITEEFVNRLSSYPNLCPHFHLSLQSGCDKTLRAMNRKYDIERFEQSLSLLRRHFIPCSVTTDIIVGFPGESDADFLESADNVKRFDFTQVHVFPYSKREGTAAAKMPNQLSKQTCDKRAKYLSLACSQIREKHLLSQVGRAVPVLFERTQNGGSFGHTPDYFTVWLNGEHLQNKIINVEITGVDGDFLTCHEI